MALLESSSNNPPYLNVLDYGAIGDRVPHLLSSSFDSAAAAERAFPALFTGRFASEWAYFASAYGFTWATDWGNATLDWMGIQSCILATRPAARNYSDSMGVSIPSGTYYTSLPIVLRVGSRLLGHSAWSESDNWPSSAIQLVSGSNVPGLITRGIIDNEYCHGLEIRNLQFLGDRDPMTAVRSSTVGSGIELARMGEMSTIDGVRCQYWAEHGIKITNIPTPGNIGRVSLFRNYVSGLYAEMGSGGQLQVGHLSGDNNGEALLKCGNSFKSTLNINSIKSERSSNQPNDSFRGNTDIVHLASTNGLTCNVGTLWAEAKDLANPGNSLFKITGATGYVTVYGNVVVRDGEETGYSKGIDNVFAGTSQTVAAVNNIGPWSTRAAAWSKF